MARSSTLEKLGKLRIGFHAFQATLRVCLRGGREPACPYNLSFECDHVYMLLGGVTHHLLPGVPHLHVNGSLVNIFVTL